MTIVDIYARTRAGCLRLHRRWEVFWAVHCKAVGSGSAGPIRTDNARTSCRT